MSTDVERVMNQCSRELFTGLLHVRSAEGRGEVRFLSGIQDEVRFDALEGEPALQRLLAANDAQFEIISALPPIEVGSKEPVPLEGRLDHLHAARLMRFCESNSLTCELELEVQDGGHRTLTARYRLGELLSMEPDSEHCARLTEAREGVYRFRLPRLALPSDVPHAAPSHERALPEIARSIVQAQGPITLKSKVAQPQPKPEPTDADERTPLVIHLPRVRASVRARAALTHYWAASIALLVASAGVGWLLLGH